MLQVKKSHFMFKWEGHPVGQNMGWETPLPTPTPGETLNNGQCGTAK